MQVKGPERPGAALVGPNRVDRAAAAAVFFFCQKDAVFGGPVLLDAVFETDAFEVFFLNLFNGYPEMFGQKLYFGLRDPDVALLRSGTAVAAAGTLKMQSALIPIFSS